MELFRFVFSKLYIMTHNLKKVHKFLDDAASATQTGAKSELYRKLFLAEGALKKVIRKEIPNKPPLVFWFQVFKYYSAASFTFLVIGILITLVVLNNSKGQSNAEIPVVPFTNGSLVSALDKRIMLSQGVIDNQPFPNSLVAKTDVQQELSNSKSKVKSLAKRSNSSRKTNNLASIVTAPSQPSTSLPKHASKSEVLASMDAPVTRSRSSSSTEEQEGKAKSGKKINSLKLLLEIEENLTTNK